MIFKIWFAFRSNAKIKEQVYNIHYPTTATTTTTNARKKPPSKPLIITPVTEAIGEERSERSKKIISNYKLPSLLSSVKVIHSGPPHKNRPKQDYPTKLFQQPCYYQPY